MPHASTSRDSGADADAHVQSTSRPSPLNRRPTSRRLVTIFRGPSNTGKTHLALSMSEAGIGRICVFDTEFKTRNVPGVNERFDAIESDPDTLLEDIQWAIDEKGPDGAPVYGGLVLDSWNGYFDTLYGRAIEMAEQQRGEGAKLTTSEVELLQTKAKKVLDLLCRVSRRWVAITEHATAQGQEPDENVAGQLIIMTIGGTDYYSDVTFDLSLVLGGDFRAQHTATVVKTNVSHLYPLGRKLVDLTYDRLVREITAQEPIKQFEPSMLPSPPAQPEPKAKAISLDDLLAKAEEYGIAEVHMSKAAARYCGGKRLEQLDTDEIEFLYNRLVESRGPDAAEDGAAPRSDRRSAAQEVDARVMGGTPDAGAPVEYAGHVESNEPVASAARNNGRGRG
ncbi:MAG: ATP-binding protein [Chloroflexota bacterium]|nr:ATP-binding protein [Chloroflexota bacterium]